MAQTVQLQSHRPEGAPGPAVDDSPLVSLTALAAEKVREILEAEREAGNVEDDMGLRLRVVGGGCSGFSYDLYFDNQTELDRTWAIQGVEVLVDEMSLMYLLGTEIDYVEGLAGAGFKFNNPNVKSTCGCGSSFGV
jgi:iron-sulfur cluster assembly accessory protein